MKNFIAISLLLVTVSCGNNIRKTIGADYDNKVKSTDVRLEGIEDRVKILEDKVNAGISELSSMQVELYSIGEQQTTLAESIGNYIDNLQIQINTNLVSIVELQLQDGIVEMIDPCGDGGGYDEVILKTKRGKLIAYFEGGANRFLSVLEDGNYQTTDQQACQFSVVNGEIE